MPNFSNKRCECGQLATVKTPTGLICERCHRIEQMQAMGEAEGRRRAPKGWRGGGAYDCYHAVIFNAGKGPATGFHKL